jgi:hypothetical protein
MIYVPKLKTPYPPIYNWIVEFKTIKLLWQNHIEEIPHPDKWQKQYPIIMHYPIKLHFDADSNTSVMVYNQEMKELVMVILRKFTGHSDLFIVDKS